MLLAVVSASSWALFAVLTKGVIEVAGDGPGALLRAPELYAWILAALVGTVFQQSAFRASTLTASLPAMTVTEPVVASVLGVTVLGGEVGHSRSPVVCVGGGGGRGDFRDDGPCPRRSGHHGC